MADNDRELYKQAQRRLVASLVYNSEKASRIFEIVQPNDFEEPALELIFTAMTEIHRKNSDISVLSVAHYLDREGVLKESGGVSELYSLRTEGEKYLLDNPAEIYAMIVKEGSAKSKLYKILKDSEQAFHDDSGISAVDGISNLTSQLNEKLYTLSDESTSADLHKMAEGYEDLLNDRERISKENAENADGLQGIPSLFPTLNKYTHGWGPQQLITIGARTGVGKALDIRTPIFTKRGWKTLEDVHVGDKVYGRDGKITKVINETETMMDRKCYRVFFDNDTSIVADAEHLWITSTQEEIQSNFECIRTTEEIKETLFENNKPNHSIFLTEPIEYKERTLPIDPYKFGKDLGNNIQKQKGIPLSYLQCSVSQRQQLMKGLADSHAAFSDMFYNIPRGTLQDDLVDIMVSLGLSVMRDKYSIRILETDRVMISDIEEIDSVPVKCIQVDNEDHTYLAGFSMIPTHNSIFAVDAAVAAARAGKSVLFFSLEMSSTELIDRIIACMSGVSQSKLKEGIISDEELELVKKALIELEDMRITVDADPKVTVDSIRARSLRKAQSEDGLDFVIIDYLQLITPVGRFNSRQEQVADISRNVKLLAKNLNIPIMVLVQLNRAKGEEEEEKIPTVDNIRESAAIANDSDVVILLHRDLAYDDTTPHTLLVLAKNRNGENNKIIRCHSNLACSLFREIKREKEAEEQLSDESIDELSDIAIDQDLDLSDFDDDIDFEDLSFD